MADHDQTFKTLLQAFFVEFIRLFFPQWAERFDFEKVEFLPAEMYTDVPEGERRTLDVVAKLSLRQEIAAARHGEEASLLALIHVEVESADRVAPFPPRMFDYYWLLRHRYKLPVLPIGLFLRVGLDGVGWDTYEECFWEQRLVHFEYAYIGLPALDAEEYVRGENILGVALAALMRVPDERRAELKAHAFARVKQAEVDDARRFLLANVIQTYLLLDEAQQAEFDRLVSKEEYRGVPEMIATWAEQQEQKGLEKGREEGRIGMRQDLLKVFLERRYRPLDHETLSLIKSWSAERLDQALLALYDGKTPADIGLANVNGGIAG